MACGVVTKHHLVSGTACLSDDEPTKHRKADRVFLSTQRSIIRCQEKRHDWMRRSPQARKQSLTVEKGNNSHSRSCQNVAENMNRMYTNRCSLAATCSTPSSHTAEGFILKRRLGRVLLARTAVGPRHPRAVQQMIRPDHSLCQNTHKKANCRGPQQWCKLLDKLSLVMSASRNSCAQRISLKTTDQKTN